MAEENITQKVRLKNMDETRNCLVEEANRNKLISKKHKNVCATLNYIEYFLILGSAITGCVSVFAFISLIGIPIGITSSAIGLKTFVITVWIKKCKSIIKEKGKEAW